MILEKLGCTYRVTLPKKIKDRFEDCCIEYAVGEIKEDDADSAYLKIISKGGLTVPSYSLWNYVCEAFALSTTSMKLLTNQIYQPEPDANTH